MLIKSLFFLFTLLECIYTFQESILKIFEAKDEEQVFIFFKSLVEIFIFKTVHMIVELPKEIWQKINLCIAKL